MSPPPTNIDGTDITGATIDGQDVQEITVDGDTVFTASALIHRYDFEDDSDLTTLTDTVGSADGSINGMNYTTNQAEDNLAGDFDGNDDFVEIPTAEGFPLSITAYIFPRVVDSGQVWISWGFDFGGNEGVAIKGNSDGNLEVFIGSTNDSFGSFDLTSRKTHIGLTIDASSNVTVYIDGSNAGSGSFSAPGGSGPSFLGAQAADINNADVILDNVEIHDKELTQSEVQSRI